eukprot:scaffold1069_cov186-Ochromonas_danica.AAC.4
MAGFGWMEPLNSTERTMEYHKVAKQHSLWASVLQQSTNGRFRWSILQRRSRKQIYFFPTTAFTFAQMLVFLPLQIVEAILYVSILSS